MIETLDSLLPWVIAVALAVALVSQLLMQLVYSRASAVGARMSGYAVARQVLDGSGLYDVEIVQVPGRLSDHYDVRRKLLQLCPDVYHGRHLAATGIAAHEASHAIQAATGHKLLLGLRDLAVPAATFGSGGAILLAVAGLLTRFSPFLSLGIVLFGAAMLLQLISLPGELHASACAGRMVARLQLVRADELPQVRRVLRVAALTYVGGTLQSILSLIQSLAAVVSRRKDDA
jgi:uncharacterized protein